MGKNPVVLLVLAALLLIGAATQWWFLVRDGFTIWGILFATLVTAFGVFILREARRTRVAAGGENDDNGEQS